MVINKRRSLFRFLAALALITVAAIAAIVAAFRSDRYVSLKPSSGALVVSGGNLFDGTGGPVRKNAILVIKDDTIVCAGADCSRLARSLTC